MSQEVKKPRVRPFADVLKEIDGGALLYDIEEALTNVIAAVREVGKQGSLQINLQIAPTGKSTVVIHPHLTFKEPQFPRNSTTFFVDDKHQPYRDDPRQEKMEFREVDKPAETPIEVPKADQPLKVVGEDD